jgi:hypothetical protein
MLNNVAMKSRISETSIVKPRVFESATGKLVAFEDLFYKMEIKNMFTVQSSEETARGDHAHIHATQMLFCLMGEIHVNLNDSINSKTVYLLPNSTGLLIPPGIWANQSYFKDSLLLTLSNWKFDEKEYIRNFKEFEMFKEIN